MTEPTLTRRAILRAVPFLGAAPMIVRASSLMNVVAVPAYADDGVIFVTEYRGTTYTAEGEEAGEIYSMIDAKGRLLSYGSALTQYGRDLIVPFEREVGGRRMRIETADAMASDLPADLKGLHIPSLPHGLTDADRRLLARRPHSVTEIVERWVGSIADPRVPRFVQSPFEMAERQAVDDNMPRSTLKTTKETT
jgi:hypothetical protein